MAKNTYQKCVDRALAYLPEDIVCALRESLRLSSYREGDVSEIRLRAHGACALVVKGRNLALGIKIDPSRLKEIFKRISGGAVYAHRDDVCRGFITLEGGIRVGVTGHARYECGRMVGVSDITSLAFRIPTGECSFARSLYAEWLLLGGGMLISSRAGEGKTTTVRALARLIGSGEWPRRVVIVDERCELDLGEYSDAHVDILSGYRRALGVDIAIRTMSAEVLIVDEISSSEDAEAMLAALGAGVTVIATVHAPSLADALRRDYVKRLVDGGLFQGICTVKRDGERFGYKLHKIEPQILHGMGDI